MSNDFQPDPENILSAEEDAKVSVPSAETDDNEDDDEEDDEDEIVPEGGAESYEGFKVVHKFTDESDDEYHDFHDLKKHVHLGNLPGISARLEQTEQESPHGRVYVRVIHDHKTAVYLHRKDEGDTTHLKISTGYNVS